MEAYKWIIGNTTFTSLDLNDIPQGVEYEIITVDVSEDNYIEVPNEVALWKIRTVLKLMQLEEPVVNALNTLSEPTRTAALYIFEHGNTIERYSQTVLFIQSVLELTDEQVDEIFLQANAIVL